MGAFNTLYADAVCPFCEQRQEWIIQFKYGDCWQHEYRLGDTLKWGGNDNGKNVGGNVRTSGIAEESCNSCGRDDIEAAVYFRDNVISKVTLLKEPLLTEYEYYEKVE